MVNWFFATELFHEFGGSYTNIQTEESVNKKRSTLIDGYVSMGAFLLQFPLFSVYHSFSAKGYIPLFLGGYSTLIACIVLPVLLVVYVGRARKDVRFVNAIDWLFFVYLLYFLLIAIYHYLAAGMANAAVSHLSVIIQFISIFMTIRLMDVVGHRARSMLCIIFIVTSLDILISYNYNVTQLMFVGRVAVEDKAADYQGYAFIYLVISMFLLVNMEKFWSRFVVALTATAMLFINGARSEFIGFFVIAFVLEYCITRFRKSLLMASFLFMIIIVALLNIISEWLPESRILSLLSFGIDGSVQERSMYLDIALKNIQENPIMGSYGNYSPGGWAHNALSAWVDLGIFGFIIFVSLLIIPLISLIVEFKFNSRRRYYALSISGLLFAILLFSTAKYFTYQIFPLVIAIFSKYKYSKLVSERYIL